MNTIGNRIYNLRKDKGITQEDLADRLAVSRQTVSRWEANLVIPTKENVASLCVLFQISEDTFFKGLRQERIYINDAEVVKILRRQYAARGNWYTMAFAIFFTAMANIALFYSVYVGLCVFPLTDAYINVSTNGYKIDHFILSNIATLIAVCMSAWLWTRFVIVRERVKIQKRAAAMSNLQDYE